MPKKSSKKVESKKEKVTKKKVATEKEKKKITKPAKKVEEKKIETRIEKPPKPAKKKRLNYYYAVGRRKSAVAKVFLFKNGSGQVEINDRALKNFFPWEPYQSEIFAPLLAVGQKEKLNVKCIVKGGGMRAQAEAIRLGVARALLKLNPVFCRALKKREFLTRDPRIKERKKYGLKRARRAPQWAKR